MLERALLLFVLACGAAAQDVGEEPDRPNVLILVADDVSDRDMDEIDTPVIDGLARRGVRFRRAYAMPICSPSRRSLQFGEYRTSESGPVCGGYQDDAPAIGRVNLGRLFGGAGYRTAFFGKWHIGSHPGVRKGEPWEKVVQLHGYDTWRAGMPTNVNFCLEGGRKEAYFRWTRVDDGVSRIETTYNTDAIRDAFIAWRDEVGDERPWYAVVNFQAPHSPFHRPPGEEEARWPRDKYAAMMTYLDTAVGEMLGQVDLARTIVVFLGDNGTPPTVHGPHQAEDQVKTTTYEEGVRVPLIVSGPGLPRRKTSQALFHLADVLPTFAELLGVTLDDPMIDGVSQLAALRDPKKSVREHLFVGADGHKTRPDHALVTARWKYREVGERPFLFDLAKDPYEAVNLAGEAKHAELLRRLERTLAQERARL